jgi:hypothetical protein
MFKCHPADLLGVWRLAFGAGMLLPGNFFSEGITPAHGHRGDNPGREAVLARILGGSLATLRIPSQGSP